VVAVVALAGIAFTEIGKEMVQRPRPYVTHPLVPIPSSPSFPSGHALNAMAIYLTLALIAASRTERAWLRALLVTGGLGLAILVGSSRVYLGVHYLTDVVGGWALGLGLALGGHWLMERWAGFADRNSEPRLATGDHAQQAAVPAVPSPARVRDLP
jgi:undecaprenyl-diphosphatase